MTQIANHPRDASLFAPTVLGASTHKDGLFVVHAKFSEISGKLLQVIRQSTASEPAGAISRPQRMLGARDVSAEVSAPLARVEHGDRSALRRLQADGNLPDAHKRARPVLEGAGFTCECQ